MVVVPPFWPPFTAEAEMYSHRLAFAKARAESGSLGSCSFVLIIDIGRPANGCNFEIASRTTQISTVQACQGPEFGKSGDRPGVHKTAPTIAAGKKCHSTDQTRMLRPRPRVTKAPKARKQESKSCSERIRRLDPKDSPALIFTVAIVDF